MPAWTIIYLSIFNFNDIKGADRTYNTTGNDLKNILFKFTLNKKFYTYKFMIFTSNCLIHFFYI